MKFCLQLSNDYQQGRPTCLFYHFCGIILELESHLSIHRRGGASRTGSGQSLEQRSLSDALAVD